MRRREVRRGMEICHRLPNGIRGRYLGTVTTIGRVIVTYDGPDGKGIATFVEIMPWDSHE